jgi:hypothetical protein
MFKVQRPKEKPHTINRGGFRCNLELRTSNLELYSERLGDVAGTNAAGADLDATDGTVVDGFYLLQVRMPGPSGLVVCMADVVAEAGAFTANFAYS